MSTHEHHVEHDPMDAVRIGLARDMREIGQLCRWLRVEAWHHASAPSMPGGDAMVMLGPVATTSEWARKLDLLEAEHFRRLENGARTRWPEIYEFGDDEQPPLQVLADWEDIIRADRDQPTGLRVTLERSLAYLQGSIDWIIGDSPITGLPNFDPLDAFAHDLRRLRRRLEAILHDGPDDRSVPCIRCTGEERGRLQPIWGDDIEGDDDTWWCSRCGAVLDRTQYRAAIDAAHRLTAVSLCATDMFTEYGIAPATLRKWAERGKVMKRGRDASGRMMYDVDQAIAQRERVYEGLRAAEEYEASEPQT